jgi:hypothetical protein
MVALNFTREKPHNLSKRSGVASLVPPPLCSPHSNLRLVGKMKPIICSGFLFDHMLKVYDRILTTEAVGRAVIRILDDSRQNFVLSATCSSSRSRRSPLLYIFTLSQGTHHMSVPNTHGGPYAQGSNSFSGVSKTNMWSQQWVGVGVPLLVCCSRCWWTQIKKGSMSTNCLSSL